MSAFLFRSQLTRLTASQLHARDSFKTIFVSYRPFSVSPALCASDPYDRNKPYLLALEKMIYAKGSNTGHGNQVTADGHQREGTLTHTIGPVVDKARSGSFWETYNKMVLEHSLDAQGRKEGALNLILLARTTEDWDAVRRVCGMLKKNNWAIESVAERALFMQAVEHTQIPLLTYLLEEQVIRVPSPRQARYVVHAIISPRGGALLSFPQRLATLLDFIRVISDPQTLAPGKSQSTAHRVRSIAPTDDIVIGSILLSNLFQAAGEESFNEALRNKSAYQALKLGLFLKDWQRRGLDGSGGDAISLPPEEKGWAYIAMTECTAALGSPIVLESLNAAWLDDQKITPVGKGKAGWAVRTKLGPRASSDWITQLREMKEWIKSVAAIFAAR